VNPKAESQGRSGDGNAREQFDEDDNDEERGRVRFVAIASRCARVNAAFSGATYREVPFDSFADRSALPRSDVFQSAIDEIVSRGSRCRTSERARGKARGKKEKEKRRDRMNERRRRRKRRKGRREGIESASSPERKSVAAA